MTTVQYQHLSFCSVPSASDQPDMVKRMETCQEGINAVSEQSVTRSWFGRLSPKGCRKRWITISSILKLMVFIRMKIDHDGSEFLGLFLDRMLYTSDESQSGPNNPNAWRAVLESF